MANNVAPQVPPRPPRPPLSLRVHSTQRQASQRRAPPIMSHTPPPPPQTAPLTPLTERTSGQRRTQSPLLTFNELPSSAAAANNSLTSPISLTTPRPDDARTCNQYVETPIRNAPTAAPKTPPPTTRPHTLPLPLHQSSTASATLIVKQPTASAHLGPLPNTVTTFTKCTNRGDFMSECTSARDTSIICSNCGQCRCESCQQPPRLPQRWLCNKKCLCSVDAVIDYATCLCCVKGLYFHCSKDLQSERNGDDVTCADDPCSCAPHRRITRWTCLAAITSVLPCLLCYWPLRACARGLEFCYAKHTRSGCRCSSKSDNLQNNTQLASSLAAATAASRIMHVARHHHEPLTPEKRLLDSSPEY